MRMLWWSYSLTYKEGLQRPCHRYPYPLSSVIVTDVVIVTVVVVVVVVVSDAINVVVINVVVVIVVTIVSQSHARAWSGGRRRLRQNTNDP